MNIISILYKYTALSISIISSSSSSLYKCILYFIVVLDFMVILSINFIRILRLGFKIMTETVGLNS